MQEPEIIYEDDALIVCYKPAGIATQTRKIGQKDMESILRNHVALAGRKTGRSVPAFIGLVHRLDQPVEGVMVFAKTKKAAAGLAEQVMRREIGKKYYALVQLPDVKRSFGEVTGLPEEGTLRHFILSDSQTNLSRIVPEKTKGAKEAKLDYALIAEREGSALLDITLHTGRHHQIRAQLSHIGTPIWGDAKYGKSESGQLALCSYYISFLHPGNGERMVYEIRPHNLQMIPFLNI